MPNVVKIDINADNNASKALDDVNAKAGKLQGGLGRLAETAGGFLAANVIGKGAGLLADQLGGAIAGASDLNESMSKALVVFGDWVDGIDEFAETSAKSWGISKQAAYEATGTFGNLFRALGMNKQEAANLSVPIVKLAADLASFNNLSPEEVLEKLRSGLVGEAEPLRSLGVNINETVVQAKALEMGLADARGELSESAKVQARYALIMEQTKTAQGDFARTSDGLANQQRILKAEWKDLQTQVGQQLLPVMLALVRFLVDEGVPALSELSDKAKEFAPTVKEVAEDVEDAAVRFGRWFEESGLLDTGLAGLITIGKGLQATIEALTPVIQKVIQFFQDHRSAVIALGIAIGALLIIMNPIPAAILGIILAVGYLSNHWDSIKAKTLEVWTAISDFINEKLGYLVIIVRYQFESIRNLIETAFKVIRDIIDIALAIFRGDWEAAWEGIKRLFSDIWEGIVTDLRLKVQLIADLAKWIGGRMVAAIWEGIGDAWKIGADIIYWIGRGIEDMAGWLWDKAMSVIGPIKDALNPKNWFGSPQGLQNWLPYYFKMGLDNLQGEIASSRVLRDIVRPGSLLAVESHPVTVAATTGPVAPGNVYNVFIQENQMRADFETGLMAMSRQLEVA